MLEKSEGATVAGLHRFVDSSLSSFLFLGHVFVVALTFFVSNYCIVGVVAI
jgi:hypothetical protein